MTKDEWYAKHRRSFQTMENRHPQRGAIVRWTMFSTDRAGRRDHPVFIAQHATATCCRGCIQKWHKIQPGKELSPVQQEYLVDVIMTWIKKEYAKSAGN